MKQCLKGFACILCFTLWVLLLIGCYYPGTPAATKMYAPYCIASINVPLADNLHTHQWDKVRLVDEDSFGRKYYIYQTPSVVLQYEIDVHIICQGETEDGQYGYCEDVCYLVRASDGNNFSEQEIIEFKEINQWNRPVNSKEIQFTSYETCNTCLIYENDLRMMLSRYFHVGEESGILLNYLDVKENTQLVFIAVFSRENIETTPIRYYLAAYRNKPSLEVIAHREVSELFAIGEDVRMFRDALTSN